MFACSAAHSVGGGRCEGRMGNLVVKQNVGFFVICEVICDNAILSTAL